MTNCIFYSIVFTLFLNFTSGGIRYSQVNRTFMSVYRGIFEASIITVGDDGEPVKPYYDENVLETYLVGYFNDNLKQYVTDYSLNVCYFDRNNDSICFDEKCRDVNLTLKAKINYFFNFEKSRNFSVYSRYEI